MNINDAFGGQKVMILSGEHQGKIASVYELSQEIFGLRLIIEDGSNFGIDIHFPAFWSEERQTNVIDSLEALEFRQYKNCKYDIASEEAWERDKICGTLDE